MNAAERVRYLARKAKQKNIVSDIKNKKREKVAQIKWSRQKTTWHHLHPKR